MGEVKSKLIITVDTEGDNLWNWKRGDNITTENSEYISRFQEVCEDYGFFPVYLTNYEMAMNNRLVSYLSEKADEKKCEIGMHLHAWNSPPIFEINETCGGQPYITEYPEKIIQEKVFYLVELLSDRTGQNIVSHRAGRWATSEGYFKILASAGIKVDCSVTPGLDLSIMPGVTGKPGNDYRKARRGIYNIAEGLVEIAPTTMKLHKCYHGSVRTKIKSMLCGGALWLRPIHKSLKDMIYLTERAKTDGYAEMVIHSSELMPGGSPYFRTENDIEQMYTIIEGYFKWACDNGYYGCRLNEFVKKEDMQTK